MDYAICQYDKPIGLYDLSKGVPRTTKPPQPGETFCQGPGLYDGIHFYHCGIAFSTARLFRECVICRPQTKL